ncbi:hypothetical protein [Bacillus tuaregi]|uniref:hypothetical protein n=1 Tax=Bacillus tuaregi TaxID=1816695 RepID=UPI0008F8AA1B|nr:hypothetical protein [Bacillus tuaregi]
MEFEMGNGVLVLPPLPITMAAIIIIFILIRWSKQLEARRFTVFFYFLISTYISPIYSQSTDDGIFEIWIPLGFIMVILYLFLNERYHPAKMKASILGLSIAIYRLISIYIA